MQATVVMAARVRIDVCTARFYAQAAAPVTTPGNLSGESHRIRFTLPG
jgi:hypothetical protein